MYNTQSQAQKGFSLPGRRQVVICSASCLINGSAAKGFLNREEMHMADTQKKYRRLSKDDAAVLFVDHQCGLTALVQDYTPGEVFVVTDASGTFDVASRQAAWMRMAAAGVQLVNWFAASSELHRDWRNDIAGFGKLISDHTPIYRALMTAHQSTKTA
jgi:hypothetical protein